LFALITTLSVPALSAQPIEGTSQGISQTSNAHALLQQGIELYEAGQFSQAIEVWQQAVSTFVTQGDPLNQALVLRYLSLAYQHLGHWQEAEGAIANSLNLLKNQAQTANTQAYLDVFAKVLNTQGRLQWAKGHLEQALETWNRAAATYDKAGNQTGIIGSLINQAQTLQALGFSTQAKGELLKVENILQQQSDPELRATGLQSLGKALRQVGRLKESRSVLQTSLQVAKDFQLSKALGSALLELGNTERALGNRAIAIGQDEDEKKHTQAAIAFYQQAADSPPLRLHAHLNLLSLLVETGKWSEAAKLQATIQPSITSLPASRTNIYARLNFARSLTCLQPNIDTITISCISGDRKEQVRAYLPNQHLVPVSSSEIAQILADTVQQARTLKDRRAESYALGQLGGLYELTEQWSASQELTQKALLLAEESQAPDIRYRWEWQLGRLWDKQGERKRAIPAYKEAVKTLNSVKSDLLTIDSDVQFSFRDNVEPIHRKLVDLLLRTEGSSEPSQTDLKEAIEAIDALQLAELENFLSCNLSQRVQINQVFWKIDYK
jgi:tetratricopeptide (TPR) repeat protein